LGKVWAMPGELFLNGSRGMSIHVAFDGQDLASSEHVTVSFEDAYQEYWVIQHLLEPLCLLLGLRRGIAFVHASALRLAGRAVLLAGWTKIGKTQILLDLSSQIEGFLADDWTPIGHGLLWSFPMPMRLSQANMESHPELASRIQKRGEKEVIQPADIGLQVEESCRPELVFILDRSAGRSLQIEHVSKDILFERLASTLSFTIVHYLSPLYAASCLEDRSGSELGQMVFETSLDILRRELAGTDVYRISAPITADAEVSRQILSIAEGR